MRTVCVPSLFFPEVGYLETSRFLVLFIPTWQNLLSPHQASQLLAGPPHVAHLNDDDDNFEDSVDNNVEEPVEVVDSHDMIRA